MFLKSYGELSSGWVDFSPVLFVHNEFSFKRCLILVTYGIFSVTNSIMVICMIVDGPWINQSVSQNQMINHGRMSF